MSAPPPGRHRLGQPLTPVYRRVWDGPARAEAEHLERSHPGWMVLYSLGGRTFYAIACWEVPEPVLVDAPTAEELQERMGQAETALLLKPAVVSLDRVRRRRASPDGGRPYQPPP